MCRAGDFADSPGLRAINAGPPSARRLPMLGQPDPFVPVRTSEKTGGPAEYGRVGFVSVWVGTFPSIEEAEAYFGIPDEIGIYLPPEKFADDFGLGTFPAEMLEVNFEQLAPRPLAQLLRDATFGPSFLDAATAAAGQQGIHQAQGVALLYDFDYRLRVPPCDATGELRVLGAFPFVRTAREAHLQPYEEIARELGFPLAAVLLVAVTLSELSSLRRQQRPGQAVQMSGREYCQYLAGCRGKGTSALLGELGLRRSEDVGRIMFGMVAKGLARQHENDSEADFQDLFVIGPDGALTWTGADGSACSASGSG
jgi:uncharacterized repeat protein (TIGR04138 family)